MQLLKTSIKAGPEDAVVEFLGEGGEKIAVTMAISDPGLGEAVLIGRAKQMMVQLTAFDTAQNDYDQQSNGNFDTPLAPALSESSG